MAKFDKILEDALQNIKLDREAANTALDEICQDIHSGKLDHGRSNEQLVKVASLMAKTNKESLTITGDEIDAIYDNLNDYKEETPDE